MEAKLLEAEQLGEFSDRVGVDSADDRGTVMT
jgi:hypothetical protein